jgi:hypothetical protein
VTPAERRRRFLSNLRAQVKRRHLQVDESVLRIAGTVVELREQLHQILSATPSDFEAHRLPELLAELDRQAGRWQAKALGEASTAIEAAWHMGPEMITGPLAAAEIHVGRLILPDSLLDELQGYAASKIKDVTPLVRERIEKDIRVAVLGGQTPHEAMKAVDLHLKTKPMRFVSFRAETIVRTEMGRVHSEAADRRHKAAAKVVKGLGKQWLWSKKSRPMHAAIDGQVRPVDEPFEMPDGVKMQYPREMGAPVEHVANCACESVPHMDDWK